MGHDQRKQQCKSKIETIVCLIGFKTSLQSSFNFTQLLWLQVFLILICSGVVRNSYEQSAAMFKWIIIQH